MLDITYDILKVELIKGSSTRVTIPQKIREKTNIDLRGKVYIGLPDIEYANETLLEISTEGAKNINPKTVAKNGRVVIPMALAAKIRNLKNVGVILCNNERIFLFCTDAMREKEEYSEYSEEEIKEIWDKVTKIDNINKN